MNYQICIFTKKIKKKINKYKLATQNHINIFTNINISLHKYGIAFGVILKYVRVSKGTTGQTFTPVLMAYFCYFTEKEPCTKFCGVLVRFHEVVKLQLYP